MNIPKSRGAAPAALAAMILLAGCGGIGPRQPTPDTNLPIAVPSSVDASALTGHGGLIPGPASSEAAHRPSWISPDVKNASAVLFVGDFKAGNVDLFTLPGLNPAGTITGLTYPDGMCADRHGNVWLAAVGSYPKVYEFSHTGNTLQTWPDTAGYPSDCAIDPTTGNLAVSNFDSQQSGSGFVQIYRHARGRPHVYSGGNIFEYLGVTYDSSGNLFADGCSVTFCTSGGTFQLAELPKGGSSFEPISLSGGTIYFPGALLWDPNRNVLIVPDPECGGVVYSACIYRIAVSGSTGAITGSTNLHNANGGQACWVWQVNLTRSGKLLAGGDWEEGASQCPSYTASGPYLWRLSGSSKDSNLMAGMVAPNGSAISYE
jgi:hypothetical protein